MGESLQQRSVLVTGAAAGLGRVVSERFAALGCHVHVCDVDRIGLQTLAVARPNLRYSVTDVGRASEVGAMVGEALQWMGGVDVLVNNVGVAGPRQPIEAIDEAAWLEVLQANLLGAVRCIRGVLPGMKQRQSGAIVNVSTASVRTRPLNRSPYTVSKAALESLSWCIAREAGPFGVRCNVVRPGIMRNERLQRVLTRVAEESGRSLESVLDEQLQFVSMRTMVEMDEVANAIIFLASPEARHISGQVIAVDGDFAWET
jgi:NAD(P)-dependent dehydrogenase (short-subunit alcohol dehydrogenase family)